MGQDHPLSRRVLRDLWYQIAKGRKMAGDMDGYRAALRSARILDGNKLRNGHL